ncbi:MAG: hypothetical protein BWX89_00007 [candidate division TA06 bacterium ADurb.Bin131]|uniref:Uncharacterized protein n=1 Tax=candidate division TA06 bacterium ADurb.Bin131 TaxID=1852827 RepID=A0A1V6CFJ2_UNCT6|nr:MAG: hypothetical protein BWX89_00007 [candidate division TA06 bacterium ADurb.Bin131]
MKKVLILAAAVFVILAINISTVRADTRYETGMFVGQAALIEADTKVFSTANFDTKPITTLKRGTIVTILSMKNPIPNHSTISRWRSGFFRTEYF